MKYIVAMVLALFTIFTLQVKAEDKNNFELKGNFIYELTADGSVKVREEIHIKNLTTERYAPSFTFNTTGFKPENVSAFENGLSSKLTSTENNSYQIVFKHPALGKGANKNAVILFSDKTLTTKHGEVTEIRIPRIKNPENFTGTTTVLKVPLEISKTFHVFPVVTGIPKGQFVEYTFDSKNSETSPITAYIGDVAAYDFTLRYPFTNTSFFKREVSFALPPDTAFQKVFIHSFSENPDILTYDSDGNWIGKLTLKARESKPFEVSGIIFVFADSQEQFPVSSAESVSLNTHSAKYWESNDPKIKELAKNLVTPRAIYDYVVTNLSYDYTKTVRPQERLGAKSTLDHKTEAICMEFTDLFIALSRAANIPAREVNGFAVSEDSNTPRALGQNILHSWPEYWDESRKLWVPVDPTWGNTTNGVDYFTHFDLKHVAFVIHGASSTLPQTPGTYETNNNDVELIHIEPSSNGKDESELEPVVSIEKREFSLWESRYTVSVKNNSGRAIYHLPISILADSEIYKKQDLVSILPFSSTSFDVSLYTGFFGSKLPSSLDVNVNNKSNIIKVNKLLIAGIHIVVLLLPFILVPTVIIFFLKQKHAKH